MDKNFFFVPLQTHNEFQILKNSGFNSVEQFIIEVVKSFSESADKDKYIVFKHHPIDRGRKNYSTFIYEQAEMFGVADRVKVYHDVHLPSCLRNAKGTVTINSTVGLSSLYHGTLVITLGKSVYNIEGITNKNKRLEEFWNSPEQPDAELFTKFYQYLILTTQVNGSFLGMFPK